MTTLHRFVATAASAAVVLSVAPLAAASAPASAPLRSVAPAPADVRATINDSGTAGRVISSRAACEREVGVNVLARSGGGYDYLDTFRTDRSGRWRAQTRRQGERFQVFAVVPGESERCDPAQSRKVSRPLRAAGPAKVRVSLRFPDGGAPRGRVSSPDAGCERGADVLIFFRPDSTGTWSYEGSTRTDRQGRYDFGSSGPRRGITDPEVTTVALASRGCDIGQSGTAPVPRT